MILVASQEIGECGQYRNTCHPVHMLRAQQV